LQRKGKRGSVVKGRGRERVCDRDRGRELKKLWNTGSSEQWRRRVTFVLDYFYVSGERK
jgi:hypothetical protein